MEQSTLDLFSQYVSNATGQTNPGADPYPFTRSILESCQHPVYIADDTDQPCSHFFQQTGAIDFKTYLRFKREERDAIIQYHAAVQIQAAWRGFLIRNNMKILNECATKIQSLVRGHNTRNKWRFISQKTLEKRRNELMNEAATKIQAAWRGYLSRKNKLDFKKYKNIQEKNEALRQSIERINELEAALLKTLEPTRSSQQSVVSSAASHSRSPSQKSLLHEQGSHKGSSRSRDRRRSDSSCSGTDIASASSAASFFQHLNNASPSLEYMIIDKFPELVLELSDNRIAELYAYLANMEAEMKAEQELEALVRKLGGMHKLSDDQIQRLEESRRIQRQRANLILELAKLIMMGPLKAKLQEKDSVDSMFHPVPDRPDVIQPDGRKVQALKDAIRMLRHQANAKTERELQKKHVLLRTQACPGVLSDIYTTELTEIERKLKSLKFWKGSLMAESKMKQEQDMQDKRIKKLFMHALQISRKNASPSDSDSYAGEEETDEDFRRYDDEYCGEEYGPEDDSMSERPCYFLPTLNPSPPPPTPDIDDATIAQAMLEDYPNDDNDVSDV